MITLQQVLLGLLALALLLLAVRRFRISIPLRGAVTLLLLGAVGYFLVIAVAEMPPFGSPDNPAVNEIPARYLERGVEETGAVNITASVIADYRAYDTLGEVTVLFTAIAAVAATLGARSQKRE